MSTGLKMDLEGLLGSAASIVGVAFLLIVYRKLNQMPIDLDDIRNCLKVGFQSVGLTLIGIIVWHVCRIIFFS